MTPPELREAWRLELSEKGLRNRRRRYCKRGHALRGSNVIYGTNPERRCRQCYLERQRRRRLALAPPRVGVCAECGRSFEPAGARGRIPARCPECSELRARERQRMRRAAKQ